MSLDLQALGTKLRRYRNQFKVELPAVAEATGIPLALIADYEQGIKEPTGDHILVLSDFYKCDYKFFVSNEKLAAFEQTETLFRKAGEELSSADRWAIQEFLFLCDCEEYLLSLVPIIQRSAFHFVKKGTFYKQHGVDAAAALRSHLSYSANEIRMDVFRDFRRIGIHAFRRSLTNSSISGLFVRHPVAGPCVLVNYAEDIYRQRFTAAHEAGHAILDADQDAGVSFTNWSKPDLSEIRAHTFASHFLMPRDFLRAIPDSSVWTPEKGVEWAARLNVSTAALANALHDSKLIDDSAMAELKGSKVPAAEKVDVELAGLSRAPLARKQELLQRGLSTFYVGLCFDAYEQTLISAGRMAEMLLVDSKGLEEIAQLYGRSLRYGD